VPAIPETQPVPEEEEPEEPEEEEPEEPEEEEPEEPEEEPAPLPIPVPVPLPDLPKPVPELPEPVPSERETERRLVPVPVQVPQVDPERKPTPLPQTEPHPNRWRVKPKAPPVVQPADPLPTRTPKTQPATEPSTQPRRERQIVPKPVPEEVVLVRRVVPEERRRVLTTEVQSETETRVVRRTRTKTKTEEEDHSECEECCEELKCLKQWCVSIPTPLNYYEGEWQQDGYDAKQHIHLLSVPGPLTGLANYINSRLADIKKELCEAIDLIAFLDQQPEPYSDRRKHGRQWKIYWGLRKCGEQSRKTLTLPEVNQSIGFPPEPPPIHDGRTCLHYGLEDLAFWGRIWVGQGSANALEAYLRSVYGNLVQFRRSENRNREYRQGQLIPTRARYWNGQKWLPPRRWQPRHYEQD
jgi:hypothetical protein